MHFRDYDRALAVLVDLNRRVSNMEEVSAWNCGMGFMHVCFFVIRK